MAKILECISNQDRITKWIIWLDLLEIWTMIRWENEIILLYFSILEIKSTNQLWMKIEILKYKMNLLLGQTNTTLFTIS